MRRWILLFAILCLSLSMQAMTRGTTKRSKSRHVVATKHSRRHRRLRMVGFPIDPALRGSRDSLLRQNEEIDRLSLVRIQDDAQLDQLISSGDLVRIENSKYVHVADNIAQDRRYARPWTVDFVNDLGKDFYAEFGKPIQVNSAVRTVEQQHKLRRHNGNAAPEFGETASSHLAGTTVDIAKRGLSKKEHRWVEDYLANQKLQEAIEPEEERRQACFHVMVSERYTLGKAAKQLPITLPAAADVAAPAPAPAPQD